MRETEIRALEVNQEEKGKMVVEGYALKFNTPSRDLGGFIEVIAPSALDNVDLSDVRCFFGHDTKKILGRTSSETLQLTVDTVGLHFRCELPNTQDGRDAYELIKRGDLSQCSFGFTLGEDGQGESWKRSEDGTIVRFIRQFESVFEVSLVAIPAYNDTNVAVALREFKKGEELRKKRLELQIRMARMKHRLD